MTRLDPICIEANDNNPRAANCSAALPVAADRLAASRNQRSLPRGLAGKLLRQLSDAGVSAICIELPNGQRYRIGKTEAGIVTPTLYLRRLNKTLWRSWLNGLLGWAEAYMAEDWDCDDLIHITDWGLHNETRLNAAFTGTRLSQAVNRLWHRLHANSRRGSRRNIAYHYDLGNNFYSQWLDPSMTYSAACFSSPQQSLAAAQQQKYQQIFQLADIQPGDHILEIGCGWGGFAELVASCPDLSLDGVTLSRQQLQWARERIRKLDAEARVKLHFCDYRDINQTYDRIISIEMFEAVGEDNWPTYFETLQRNLKPGGVAVLQIICIEPARFASYRTQTDFIQRYVFPGGMLPTAEHILQLSAEQGLEASISHRFGQDYAQTLGHWRQRFLQHWDTIAPLGYDNHFKRLWDYYLCYCESGFRYDSIDVCHFTLRKPALSPALDSQ